MLRAARVRAAGWRAEGDVSDLASPLHPPAQSALLARDLLDSLGRPLDPVPSAALWSRGRRRLGAMLLPELTARVSRLEEYLVTMTSEVALVLGRLDVQAAELRARVGLLEERLETSRTPPST
ncbi:MAG: hypothetical protein ACR2NJ_11635 [Acidimicrobiales bacterium]